MKLSCKSTPEDVLWALRLMFILVLTPMLEYMYSVVSTSTGRRWIS